MYTYRHFCCYPSKVVYQQVIQAAPHCCSSDQQHNIMKKIKRLNLNLQRKNELRPVGDNTNIRKEFFC